MMNKKNYQKYIYFLQLTPALPEEFFKFAAHFKRWEIDLIPVEANKIAEITTSQKQFIIALNKDFTSIDNFEVVREKFLNFALKREVFTLFDISSFGKMDGYQNYEKKGSYVYLPLPGKYKDFCKRMAAEYYIKREQKGVWPGGRRAKLPPLNS